MRWYLLLAPLLVIAACQPETTTTTAASDASTTAFSVEALTENDIQIQGCTTTLSRAGSTDTIFAEDGADTTAKGFIRIGGQLINVILTSASGDEQHSTRNFADTDHVVAVVETLTTGAAHEESDSVDQSGTLAVTYHGATRVIPVEGGTAC